MVGTVDPDGGWGGFAENAFASFTPSQGVTGAGGLHRSSPVGGAANGIPRYTRSPFSCNPEIYPASVFTTVGSVGVGFCPDESDEYDE
jgi:hypothetical protein